MRTALSVLAAASSDYETALRTAVEAGGIIGKHADPTEGAREGLTVEEALEIASEDVALVYVVIA
jgi:hypothetical protein